MTNAERIKLMEELKTEIENCKDKDEVWFVSVFINSWNLNLYGIETKISVWKKPWIVNDADKRRMIFNASGEFVETDGEKNNETISKDDIKNATAFVKQWLKES